MIVSDNVDYANKIFNIYGKIGPYITGREWRDGVNSVLTNDFNSRKVITFPSDSGLEFWTSLVLNYTLNGMPTSFNETRVKSKFFSLMIYAGYPA